MRLRLFVSCIGLAVTAWLIAPTSASAQLDHYACYQVKDAKVPDKLAKLQSGTHDDQIATGNYEKCKMKFLCAPTSKNGSGINDPSAVLCCHQCKGVKFAKPRPAFDITDQFVNGRVETKKLKFICNPCTNTPA